MVQRTSGDPLISQAHAAKLLGINRSTLSRQIKQGLIRSHQGNVRLSEVKEDRTRNLDTTRQVRYPVSSSLAAARAKKEVFLANLRELEYGVKSGRFVDAELVRRRVFELSRSNRDALMNWPARVAPLIAAEFGIDQVRLAVCLEAHVRQHLSERAERPTLDLKSGRSR
jgi:hypothetical protein